MHADTRTGLDTRDLTAIAGPGRREIARLVASTEVHRLVMTAVVLRLKADPTHKRSRTTETRLIRQGESRPEDPRR